MKYHFIFIVIILIAFSQYLGAAPKQAKQETPSYTIDAREYSKSMDVVGSLQINKYALRQSVMIERNLYSLPDCKKILSFPRDPKVTGELGKLMASTVLSDGLSAAFAYEGNPFKGRSGKIVLHNNNGMKAIDTNILMFDDLIEGIDGNIYYAGFSSRFQSGYSVKHDKLFTFALSQKKNKGNAFAFAYLPYKQLLATSYTDKRVLLTTINVAEYDLNQLPNYFDIQDSLEISKDVIIAMDFDQCGKLLAAADKKAVRVVDVETHTEIFNRSGFKGKLINVALSPMGNFLYVHSGDGTALFKSAMYIYDLNTGELLIQIPFKKLQNTPGVGVNFEDSAMLPLRDGFVVSLGEYISKTFMYQLFTASESAELQINFDNVSMDLKKGNLALDKYQQYREKEYEIWRQKYK